MANAIAPTNVGSLGLAKGTSRISIANEAIFSYDETLNAVVLSVNGGAAASLGNSILAPWFAAQLAVIQAKVSTLTDIIVQDEAGRLSPNWQTSSLLNGTALPGISTVDLQTTATASSTIGLVPTGNSTTGDKYIPNLRTNKYAIAARVTKIANTVTCDTRMINAADNATGNSQIGIVGATSQVNYTFRTSGVSIADLGVAQSAAGTYDTLILIADGTNIFAFVGLGTATPVQVGSQAQVGMPNAAGFQNFFASNGATAANAGFKYDKVMVVMEPAT